MLRVDRKEKSLTPLPKPTLVEASILERQDLQEFIFNSTDAFFKELGTELFLIGKEIQPSEVVQDRIDLLALDREGTTVVIELKRGSNKLQHMQAISYAAMVSKWSVDDFTAHLSDEKVEALNDFLDVDLEAVNRSQSVFLVAEAFDYSLLVACEWLNEIYGVDLVCHRLSLAKDPKTKAEYIACDQAYPPLEIAKQAIKRGGSGPSKKSKWANWEDALSGVSNKAVLAFFRKELEAGTDPYLRKRQLRFLCGGRKRWSIYAKSPHAYVWQSGRFEDDLEFWKEKISDPGTVTPVKKSSCVRFKLFTEADFTEFRESLGKLNSVKWFKLIDVEENADDVEG